MIPQEKIGADLHGDDADARKEAARMMGRARTERKVNASRANAAKAAESRIGKTFTDEQRVKLKEAQRLRREREQAAREASGVAVPSAEKRPPGRPRKVQPEQTTETAPQPQRGRGRPRKAEQATLPMETPQEGA